MSYTNDMGVNKGHRELEAKHYKTWMFSGKENFYSQGIWGIFHEEHKSA